jgi:hypothetical protein
MRIENGLLRAILYITYSEDNVSEGNCQNDVVSIELIHMFRHYKLCLWIKHNCHCVAKNELDQTVHDLSIYIKQRSIF